MSKILMSAMLVAVLVCAGCGNGGDGSADVLDGATAAGFLNSMCPIMGEEIDKEEGGSVDYKGAKIGFCCPKCGGKFDAMSDADKVAALAKVGTKLP